MKSELDVFVEALIRSLSERYNATSAVVTPDSILLAVLNAVCDARAATRDPLPQQKP